MKRLFMIAAMLLLLASCGTKEKEIYIPKDLQEMELNDPESEYCYERMALTDNFAIFWDAIILRTPQPWFPGSH